MRYPIEPVYLTQRFGENPQVYKQFGIAGHNGLDFRVKFVDSLNGKRSFYAAMDGEVIEVENKKEEKKDKKGYGNFCRVRHDGNSQTVYGHATSIQVKVGDVVHEGDVLGITGNTGFSTSAHLHFGYRPDGWQDNHDNGFKGYIDPLPFLEGRAHITVQAVEPDFAKKWAGWLVIVPELGGETWFVSPKTFKRYKLSGGVKSADAALLARDGAWVGMTVKDILKIPNA